MKSKKTLLIVPILAIMLCLSFAGVLFTAGAATAPVTVSQTVGDFDDAGEKTQRTIDFDSSVGMDGGTYFESEKSYTGAHTVDISIYTSSGGAGDDFVFAIGNLSFRKDVSNLYASSPAVVLYEDDGETPTGSGQTIGMRKHIDMGFATDCIFNFRFDILSDGNINLYFAPDGNPVDYGVRYVIKFADGANDEFALTNGKIKITPMISSSEPASGRIRQIKEVSVITQKAEENSENINKSNLLLDGQGAFTENDISVYDFSGNSEPAYTLSDNKMQISQKFIADKEVVKIVPNYDMRGEYVADLALYNKSSQGTAYKIRIGDKNPSAQSLSGNSNGGLEFQLTAAGTMDIVSGGATFDIPEGEQDYINATMFRFKTIFGNWFDGNTLYLRFAIKPNNKINVYIGHPNPLGEYDPQATPNATITVSGNEDYAKTDGYLSVTPYMPTADGTLYDRRVDALGLYGTYSKKTPEVKDILFDKTGINQSANGAKIVGASGSYVVCGSFKMDYAANASLVSKYSFDTNGLENDDDIVFSVKFMGKATTPQGQSGMYGFMFGLPDGSSGKANAAGYISVNSLTITVYKKGTATPVDTYEPGIYTDGADITWTLVAKKNGTLSIKCLLSGYTYEKDISGFDFGGKIGFFTEADSSNVKWVDIRNLEVSGNMNVNVSSVKIRESVFTGASVGRVITLSAASETYPVVEDTHTFSIVEGGEFCELINDGTQLKITGAGHIKIKAASNLDNTVFAEYEFDAQDEKAHSEYDVIEDFSEYNDADWTIISTREEGSENVGVRNGSLYLTVDWTDDDYAARDSFVSNTVFEPSENDDIVFDITFSAAYAGLSMRNDSIGWGLTFGMKSVDSKAFDDGVGYFRINYISTAAYLGDKKISPSYLKDGASEQGGVFCADSIPYKVRLVAKKNGRLDVYRAMSGFGYVEKIEDLLATYEGFDFTGYIGFTSDVKARPADDGQAGTARDKYDVIIYDLSLSGNIGYEKDSKEIKRVVIDESVFRDAIVSEIPLELKAEAYAVPNIALFKGVIWSVADDSKDKAVVEDGKLKITGAGEITVRATSAIDGSKYADCKFTAIVLNITGITIVGEDTIFDGITNDTQPIDLSAIVACNSIANKYQAVKWEVVSGPAQIVLDQLRITGVGEVKIKVSAVYDESVCKEVTFTVSDNDLNIEPVANKKGCKNSAIGFGGIGAACAAVSVAAVALLLTRKKRAK